MFKKLNSFLCKNELYIINFVSFLGIVSSIIYFFIGKRNPMIESYSYMIVIMSGIIFVSISLYIPFVIHHMIQHFEKQEFSIYMDRAEDFAKKTILLKNYYLLRLCFDAYNKGSLEKAYAYLDKVNLKLFSINTYGNKSALDYYMYLY